MVVMTTPIGYLHITNNIIWGHCYIEFTGGSYLKNKTNLKAIFVHVSKKDSIPQNHPVLENVDSRLINIK